MIDFNECRIILHHKLEQSYKKYSFIIGNISMQYAKFRETYLILFTHSLNSLFNQSSLLIKTSPNKILNNRNRYNNIMLQW